MFSANPVRFLGGDGNTFLTSNSFRSRYTNGGFKGCKVKVGILAFLKANKASGPRDGRRWP